MSGRDQAEMYPLARKALERLLKSADKHEAGVATRRPALTGSALASYHALRSLKDKEAFEAVMAYGQSEGAIKIQRPRYDPQGLIERVELVDVDKLAALLGEVPHAVRVEMAKQTLSAHLAAHPVLADVLSSWEKLKKVRGTAPDDAAGWASACDVIAYCLEQVALGDMETPVRDASARFFKDSKRIESLVPRLDVLLAGNVEDDARSDAEVLQELGLYREQQPARLAGNIVVRRERGAFPLDRPYTALPPSTVLGLGGAPNQVLTIENQTTFNVWARQHCDSDVLCLYTGGMPSPAWRAMYLRLLSELPISTPVLHWGDVDEGGFRIAAFLSRCAAEAGHVLLPWKMRPADVPEPFRREASARTVDRMVRFAGDAGWDQIAQELAEAKFVAEQEG
ncbi:Wadjet anti-phage system protein JetD domain-containing protein [Roseateles sp.]|uniref:Wadjet anti-phage system protein JetD domain-containing protein n=1 Tax=Roseateles sp. TaxID=1971397 RepID=UPI0039E7EF45